MSEFNEMFNMDEVQAESTGWKALQPGRSVGVKLVSVAFATKDEVETDDLVFSFKGIDEGNRGDFNYRMFATAFDEYFNGGKKGKMLLTHIKHIAAAYLPKEVVATIVGKNWKEIAAKAVSTIAGECLSIEGNAKVILDGKDRCTFPTFPDFITTALTPDRVLSLGTKINTNTGLIYDRITPIGEAPANDAPTPGGAAFGATDAPAPAFGA